MHACEHICSHEYMCAGLWKAEVHLDSLQSLSTIFFCGRVSQLNRCWSAWLIYLAGLGYDPLSTCKSWNYRVAATTHPPHIYIDSEDLNSDPVASKCFRPWTFFPPLWFALASNDSFRFLTEIECLPLMGFMPSTVFAPCFSLRVHNTHLACWNSACPEFNKLDPQS